MPPRRRLVAAQLCIAVALVFVGLLGGWGAYRDISYARQSMWESHLARLRSHGERTVGHIESELAEGLPPHLEWLAEARWLRIHWKTMAERHPERVFAAITNDLGTLVASTGAPSAASPASWRPGTGGAIPTNSFAEAVEDPFQTFEFSMPIYHGGVEVGHYHAGMNRAWIEERWAPLRRDLVIRWTSIIAAIALVVLLASGSLYYITRRTFELQRSLDLTNLRRADELNGLAKGLAHEIRNPLNAIRLNLSSVERSSRDGGRLCPADMADVLAESAREIERIDDLLGELLGYACADPQCLEDVDLVAELESLVEFLRASMDERNIIVRFRPPSGPVMIRIDRHQLRQVLLNLLRNANDAVRSGGLIGVAIEEYDGQVRIIVDDNGPGVSAADRQRIFDPFYSTKDEGTGLGLALVRQYVTRHAGTVRCESAAGGGSRFVIEFPAAAALRSAQVLA